MAFDPMTPERLAAGVDYHRALVAHDIQLEGMFWAFDQVTNEISLAIVSSLVDRVGPQEVYDTLFKAYDAAVTPQTIDPWIVALYSPNTLFAEQMRQSMTLVEGPLKIYDEHDREIGALDSERFWYAGPYMVREPWVYVKMRPKPPAVRQINKWRQFVKHVNQVAA